MSFDYTPIAADAKELVEDFGRAVTFVMKGRTPTDATKPWRGPSQIAANPVSPAPNEPVSIAGVIAAIVPSDNQDEPNSIVRRIPRAIAFVAATSFPAGTEVENLDSIVDTDTTWRIVKIETIDPGDLKVLHVMYLEG